MNNHEDEVKRAMATKLAIKIKRKLKKLDAFCACRQCKDNVTMTIDSIIKFGKDVFNLRPEFHAAIIILAEGSRDMLDEMEKTQTGDVILL